MGVKQHGGKHASAEGRTRSPCSARKGNMGQHGAASRRMTRAYIHAGSCHCVCLSDDLRILGPQVRCVTFPRLHVWGIR